VLGGSIDLADRDLTGVEVVMTDRLTAASGIVATTAAIPVEDVSVLIFPADRRFWLDFGAVPQRFRETRVDNAGRYETWVPPGDYDAIATPTAREFWMESEWLARLSSLAERITLRDGVALDRGLRAVVVASGR
jgi:hypothetical protein